MTEKRNLVETSQKVTIANGTNTKTKDAERNGFSQLKEEEKDAQEIEDTLCGIGSCKPKWLQYLATKEVYMLAYSIIGLALGMFFTYNVAVISTIEKRFKLTSKQTGAMLSGNDISQVILSMVLGYYGNYGHRPRWMGVGVMFAALSCFLAALPHFVYGSGHDAISMIHVTSVSNTSGMASQRRKEELCLSDNEESCFGDDSIKGESYLGPVILLFVSQFNLGIAVSIFFSIGVAYLDDNINKKKTPIYYAVSLMIRILGPVFGFFLGGKCLSIWIDPNSQPNLSTRDPRWLGAWWLGFLILGSILAFLGKFLFLFPRKLPATLKRERRKMEKQAEKDAMAGGNKGVDYFISLNKTKKAEAKPSLRNMKKALKRLFTNKIWVGNLFSTVTFILAMAGYWNFKPKYLENQFRKSASEANFYTGLASLMASVVGTGVSGAILRWVRPGPKIVTGYNLFLTLFGCCTYISLMFIGCPKLDVIGPVGESTAPLCSMDCGCSNKFSPVCAEDQTTLFYSPCYAGCTVANTSSSPQTYSNCRCIGNSSFTSTMNADLLDIRPMLMQNDTEEVFLGGSAVRGHCPEPCNAFKYFIILQIVTKAILSTGRVGGSIVNLRSVADEDKGLALGTITVFISLFGFIPAPMIMGAIIDSACLVWDKTCGVRGNCWHYDSDKFRILLHLVPAVFIFISVFGDIVVYYYSNQLDLYGDREEDVEMEKAKGETEESKPMNTPADVNPNDSEPVV